MSVPAIFEEVADEWAAREAQARAAAYDEVPGALEHAEAAVRVIDFLGDLYYHARAVEHYAQEARAKKLGTIMPDGFPY